MDKVDAKDVYVASQIFESLDNDSKGFLSTEDMAERVANATDEPIPSPDQNHRGLGFHFRRIDDTNQMVRTNGGYRRSVSETGHHQQQHQDNPFLYHLHNLGSALKSSSKPPMNREDSLRAASSNLSFNVKKSTAFVHHTSPPADSHGGNKNKSTSSGELSQPFLTSNDANPTKLL